MDVTDQMIEDRSQVKVVLQPVVPLSAGPVNSSSHSSDQVSVHMHLGVR